MIGGSLRSSNHTQHSPTTKRLRLKPYPRSLCSWAVPRGACVRRKPGGCGAPDANPTPRVSAPSFLSQKTHTRRTPHNSAGKKYLSAPGMERRGPGSRVHWTTVSLSIDSYMCGGVAAADARAPTDEYAQQRSSRGHSFALLAVDLATRSADGRRTTPRRSASISAVGSRAAPWPCARAP